MIGLSALTNVANRRTPGITSRKTWSRLPARSGARTDSPVTLPPGRASARHDAATDRVAASAKTIGMTAVACFAATLFGVPKVTMTSTLSRTNWAAISANGQIGLPPSDTRLLYCGLRSSQVRAGRCERRQSTDSEAEGVCAPKNPTVGSCSPAAARAPRAATLPPRRRAEDEFAPFHGPASQDFEIWG